MERQRASQLGVDRWPFERGSLLLLALLYLAGFLIVFWTVGPGEALRRFAAEATLLALWLAVAHYMLGDAPVAALPIRRPASELGLGGLAYVALVVGAVGRFAGLDALRPLIGLLGVGLPLAVLFGLRYGRTAWGLTWGSRRAWLALLAVVAVNILISQAGGRLLPPGELPLAPGEDLSESIEGPLDALALIGQLLLIAALPEEMFFRVYMQPRLAHYLPIGLAIVAQAVLFSAAHLPRELLHLSYSWPLALAGVLSISNGVIAGYLWWRTRSLPLLLVLHLFAFIRFGL